MDLVTTLRLAGYAAGAFGAALLFLEFFQIPNYVTYDDQVNLYTIDMSPNEVRQHTWIGRIGAIAIAVAFALLFFATFL
jgi:hypothetical protein